MESLKRNGNYQSVFTGTMFGLLGINLATILVTGITFGLAYPWVICWKESWLKEHTYICGRRLFFNGTGMQLVGSWLKWLLLSIVTFGIYSLWLPIKIEQWKVKHTCFADEARYFAPAETDSRFGEWLSDVISTVKNYALMLWNKLCAWINGMQQSSAWTCSCGHRNPSDSRFCTVCGKQKEALTRCPNCGASLAPNAKFCGACGYLIHRD